MKTNLELIKEGYKDIARRLCEIYPNNVDLFNSDMYKQLFERLNGSEDEETFRRIFYSYVMINRANQIKAKKDNSFDNEKLENKNV